MQHTRQKGKISHDEWQKITAQYESGVSIAEIGRTYGCTPPAIRYIIRKSGVFRADSIPADRLPNAATAPDATAPRSPAAAAHARAQKAGRAPASPPVHRTDADLFGLDLRNRVSGDVAAFLAALDQVSSDDQESLAALHDAADRLMRTTARVRIDLDRLLVHTVRKSEERPPPPPPSIPKT
jgi:hypothetical protein